ncbi:MAG: hypothetical protein IT450_19955 [Phycisphaerales bacterium]|nr:hypothetical protein [Phycisphaerales bacterium]
MPRNTPLRFFLRAFVPAWVALTAAGAARVSYVGFVDRFGRAPAVGDALDLVEPFARGAVFSQPFILPFAVCIGSLWAIAPGLFRAWRSLPRTCPQCEYSLRGNTSGRCPECGFDFDVTNPLAATIIAPKRIWLARAAMAAYLVFLFTLGSLLVR